ncbi:MAG: STAS domain-containing protein [Betaproteobacteria bacterium]|nr:STAS domain-containing protein [Betaproteobacteria bacterium]
MDSIDSGTVAGESLKLEGTLNFASMQRLLTESSAYSLQPDLPNCLAIDFSNVTDIDSSAVALLLHWRRAAMGLKKQLRYINLPPNLVSLAQLYGVDQLINCPSQQTPCPSPD